MAMLRSKTIFILVVALMPTIGIDALVRKRCRHRVSFTDRLAVQPVENGVYLLGNSLFETGVISRP